jgi:hypothetical protein
MNTERLELPQGTLDLLILKAVALEPLHGGRSRNGSIRSQVKRYSSDWDRFTLRSIALSDAAGSNRAGAPPRTTGVRNITSSQSAARHSSGRRPSRGDA